MAYRRKTVVEYNEEAHEKYIQRQVSRAIAKHEKRKKKLYETPVELRINYVLVAIKNLKELVATSTVKDKSFPIAVVNDAFDAIRKEVASIGREEEMITYEFSARDATSSVDNPKDKVVVLLDKRVVGAIIPVDGGYQYVTKNNHKGEVFVTFREVVRSL